MTGHQVYSTLHTNSALGVVPRLLDIGIRPDILAGNIIGVVAQRLVRKLCSRCKESYRADELECQLLRIPRDEEPPAIYRAVGCEACDHQGYLGRTALMEILRIDPDIDELLVRGATPRELRNLALEKGFEPLAVEGSRKVLTGVTSLSEISRVVDLTDRIPLTQQT